MLRVASCAVLFSFAACRSTPVEPGGDARVAPVRAVANAPYRPVLTSLTQRLVDSLAETRGNAATPPRALDVRRIELAGVPSDIDVVAWRDESERWHAAAVESDQVHIGLAGAERIYTRLAASGESPSAFTLARVVGTLHYYPWRVFDGTDWTPSPIAYTPQNVGSTPSMTQRPGGTGRTLIFSYAIPDGAPGAGFHLANIHLTDSGYLIDAAPNPERR